MKRIRFILLFWSVSFMTKAQTFHGIIFANTFDAKIGHSVNINYNKMLTEFAAIASANNMKIEQHYFRDFDYNKDKLMETLNNIQFSSQDIAFFYHTGHGGRATNDKTKWPQLALGDYDSDFVSLNRVLEILKQKSTRPQLIIVMSQSCNSESSSLTAKESISGGNTVLENSTSDNYQKLFKNLKGTIIVSSSSPGQYSYSSGVGSTFTNAWLKELQHIVSGNGEVNWNTLFERTKQRNAEILKHTDPNSYPQWEVNVTSTSGGDDDDDITIKTNSEVFVNDLLGLANTRNTEIERIRLVRPLLQKHFDNEFVKVQILGKNGKTIVERQSSERFLKRLSTTRRLVGLAVLEKKTNSNGKITFLKIHEIYKR